VAATAGVASLESVGGQEIEVRAERGERDRFRRRGAQSGAAGEDEGESAGDWANGQISIETTTWERSGRTPGNVARRRSAGQPGITGRIVRVGRTVDPVAADR
jgi:hypothetical protein